MKYLKILIVIADIIVFALMVNYLPVDKAAAKGLGLLTFIGILWLTEALNITITALLVPVLAVLMGILTTNTAFVSFANTTIFLFFGGYALATAIHSQQLDSMIATKLINMARGNFTLSVLGLFGTTVFMSMWVSNTVATAVMLPLAIGLLHSIDAVKYRRVYAFVILGIAYSSSVGGLGTSVSSPPNAILVSQLNISFTDMFFYGFPILLILFPFMFYTLYVVFNPELSIKFEKMQDDVKMNKQRWITLVIFTVVAIMWIFSKYINPLISSFIGLKENIAAFDSVIAVIGAIILVTTKVTSWKEISDHTNWGLFYIFGGGITLTLVLSQTGASKVLADSIVSLVDGSSYFIMGLMVALFAVFFTELATNVAVATLLIPLFISIAQALGIPPLGLGLIIAFTVNCAFMLPVAGASNAMVYGTGYIKQSDMVKAGFILNIISAVIISTFAYWFWL